MRSTWEVDYIEAHTEDSESHNTTEGGDDEENNSSSSETTTSNCSYSSLEMVKAMKRNFPCLRSYVCRRRLSCVALLTIGLISIGLIVTFFHGESNFFGGYGCCSSLSLLRVGGAFVILVAFLICFGGLYSRRPFGFDVFVRSSQP